MSEAIHTAERLAELQALSLNRKIQITQTRIIEWYQHFKGNVYVAFSGGKDSTVLLDIARRIYPDIHAVFCNTGLEYPEIQKFVKNYENVDIITPRINFRHVIETYGYPLIGKDTSEVIATARRIHNSTTKEKSTHYINYRRKVLSNPDEVLGKHSLFSKAKWLPLTRDVPALISNRCCGIIKKSPFNRYGSANNHRRGIIATLAEESMLRTQGWIRTGCNAFNSKKPQSQPLSFWTGQDILTYLVDYDIPIASVYGSIVSVDEDGNQYSPRGLDGQILGNLQCTGCNRTGCIFCAYGLHLEKGETRFQRLAYTHPRQYEYCIKGGEWRDNPYYDPVAPKYDEDWINWNPKKIWTANDKGLGLGKVFDMVNELYGKNFYRYD